MLLCDCLPLILQQFGKGGVSDCEVCARLLLVKKHGMQLLP
jgi:hypothetical protein